MRAEIYRAWAHRFVRLAFLVVCLITGLIVWDLFTQFDALRDAAHVSEVPQQVVDATGPREGGAALRRDVERKTADLSLSRAHLPWTEQLASGVGIGIAVIVAGSVAAVPFRRRYISMLALHEPRRARLLGANALAVWALLLGLVVISALCWYAAVAVGHAVLGLGFGGAPDLGSAILAVTKVWVVWVSYGMAAVAVAWVFWSSLGAFLGVIALILGDWLLIRNWTGWRIASPGQQVAALLADNSSVLRSSIGHGFWMPAITSREVTQYGPNGTYEGVISVPLAPIAEWQALLVLLGWAILWVGVAYWPVRWRDLP